MHQVHEFADTLTPFLLTPPVSLRGGLIDARLTCEIVFRKPGKRSVTRQKPRFHKPQKISHFPSNISLPHPSTSSQAILNHCK
nr:MAG TPA_asm: hypothetical protein [Caudoviricetes sp.]